MAKFLEDGGLGEVYLAKGLCYKWRKPIGRMSDEPVPKGVHYDLWLGPAPLRPFNRNRFHYNWHWNWDYGNGDIGNQGVHEIDVARWGLGVKLPTRVHAAGGHFMFDDDQQTPNALMAMFEFPNPKGAAEKKKILSSRCAAGSPTAKTRSSRRSARRPETGRGSRQRRGQPVLRIEGLHGEGRRGMAHRQGETGEPGRPAAARRITMRRS